MRLGAHRESDIGIQGGGERVGRDRLSSWPRIDPPGQSVMTGVLSPDQPVGLAALLEIGAFQL